MLALSARELVDPIAQHEPLHATLGIQVLSDWLYVQELLRPAGLCYTVHHENFLRSRIVCVCVLAACRDLGGLPVLGYVLISG